MSNFKQHFLTGSAVGCLVAAYHPAIAHLPLLQRLLIGGLVSGAAAALPDIIEPATSPAHRSVAHSFSALGLSLHGGFKSQIPILTLVSVGYASHLVLDAGTPASLPWLS